MQAYGWETDPPRCRPMPQLATAFASPTTSHPESSLADTLALIAQAGSTIADLRARLARAERTIALLEDEKRTARAEPGTSGQGPQAEAMPAGIPANRSHLDDTLAALVEGLGPSMVRLAP